MFIFLVNPEQNKVRLLSRSSKSKVCFHLDK